LILSIQLIFKNKIFEKFPFFFLHHFIYLIYLEN
jgi:hypothetical protein